MKAKELNSVERALVAAGAFLATWQRDISRPLALYLRQADSLDAVAWCSDTGPLQPQPAAGAVERKRAADRRRMKRRTASISKPAASPAPQPSEAELNPVRPAAATRIPADGSAQQAAQAAARPRSFVAGGILDLMGWREADCRTLNPQVA